jgi:hypothetical protein
MAIYSIGHRHHLPPTIWGSAIINARDVAKYYALSTHRRWDDDRSKDMELIKDQSESEVNWPQPTKNQLQHRISNSSIPLTSIALEAVHLVDDRLVH